jgi:hypothetical protein
MKIPRFSIGSLMILVLVAALDAVAVRTLLRGISPSVNLALLGAVPMTNLLVLACFPWARRGPRRAEARPLWFGFELFGWAAVVLHCACSFACTEQVIACINAFFDPIVEALDALGLRRTDPVHPALIFLELVMVPAALTMPQVFLALIGGWWGRLADRNRRLAEVEQKLALALAMIAELDDRLAQYEHAATLAEIPGPLL